MWVVESSRGIYAVLYLVVQIGLSFALQEKCCRFGVVLLRSDVQGGQTHFGTFGVILEENGDHLVVALLKAHRQRGKSVLEKTNRTRCDRGQSSFLLSNYLGG